MEDYIENGFSGELVDPDGGANVERKRQQLAASGHSVARPEIQFPESGWMKSLKKLPAVRFPTIYRHFMENSLVSSARSSLAAASDDSGTDTELFSSFKGIDKRYNFFKSGHVQKIELSESSCCYVRCDVLPSMRRSDPYKVKVCLSDDGMVVVALCTCTAGLGGCCNHVAALLYALEEFVRFGLREEDEESPTSRLCRWNRPRSRKEEPRRVSDVWLHRPFFGAKRQRAPKPLYNPVPPNKRLVEPGQLEKLRKDLQASHEQAVAEDKNGNVKRYGCATWLTALEASSDESEVRHRPLMTARPTSVTMVHVPLLNRLL